MTKRKTPLTRECKRCSKTFALSLTRRGRRQIFCTLSCQSRSAQARQRIAHPERYRRTQRIHRWVLRMQSIEYGGGGCVDCGYKDNLAALEFDHVRGKNYRTVSDMIATRLGWEIIQTEIDLCDLVCANCHSIRTDRRLHSYG